MTDVSFVGRQTYDIPEQDRQLLLIALAHLAVARPEWDAALGKIAETLAGRPLFETFKEVKP